MLVSRTTRVKCDICHVEADIKHDNEYFGSSHGPFNRGLSLAGWGEPFDLFRKQYLHLCQECYKTWKTNFNNESTTWKYVDGSK